MLTPYGRRDDALVAPVGDRVYDALARAERWYGPAAIVALFAYPNPFVPVALAALAVSLAARALRPGSDPASRLGIAPAAGVGALDAGLALFVLGALIGLGAAHDRDAAALRFTGLVAAVGTFYLVGSWLRSRLAIRRAATLLLVVLVVGILLVLLLAGGVIKPVEGQLSAATPATASTFQAYPALRLDAQALP